MTGVGVFVALGISVGIVCACSEYTDDFFGTDFTENC